MGQVWLHTLIYLSEIWQALAYSRDVAIVFKGVRGQ